MDYIQIQILDQMDQIIPKDYYFIIFQLLLLLLEMELLINLLEIYGYIMELFGLM